MPYTITNKQGALIDVHVVPIDSELDLKDKAIKDVRAYCFYKDKFVIVWSKDHWNTPGGGIEVGESIEDATKREVLEETNMRVIEQRLIFLQAYSFRDKSSDPEYKPSYQVVSVCRVEPIDKFTLDPDGDITEIKLIDPLEYKTYINWGERGDVLMKRAVEIKLVMDEGIPN
jgi:ADP-ribose pyrophosphatase YjhB (NUDIX family)